jgi:tripartite-type tricarboxylate transporter receptor subunit TctC
LGNHVTAVLAEHAPLSEHLKSGNLRALASTSKTRIPFVPELSTVAETYADFEVDFWWGLFATAQTPQTTAANLAERFESAMEVQELKAKLIAWGFFPTGTCGGL